MALERKIRVGIIGAGYWGPNLIRNFHQSLHTEVEIVCDTNRSRLDHMRELYPSLAVCTDYRDITRMDNIDAVCIATPVRFHYEMAKDALEHGKHTMVEKPLTSSVVEAQNLIDIAGNETVLMVDHTFEYAAAVNTIRELVAAGELGDIYYVSMSRLNLGLFQKDINVIWDLAPHDISILNFVLGIQPERVAARGNANILTDVADVAMVDLYYSGNIVAYLHVSWLDPNKTRRATFVGSKKMLVYDDVEPLEKIKIFDKGVESPKHYDTFGDFQFSYRYGDIYTPYLHNAEPLKVECSHFVDCITNGIPPRSDGKNGLNVVSVLEAAQRSLEKEGRVEEIVC